MDAPRKGHVRVGRIVDRVNPSLEAYKSIVVMLKSHSKWWPLSPYFLNDEQGCIMENIWQFSKVYPTLPASTQKYSQWDSTVIWQWPAETHIHNNKLLPAYWHWREQGMHNPLAVRYPVGFKHKHTAAYSLVNEKSLPIDYIEARKQIYISVYTKLAKQQAQFQELQDMLNQGTNILIIEVDGPHQESLDYYKNTYGVTDNFIQYNTMRATHKNLSIMLNDSKHSFGHGYCLAAALLDIDLH